MSEGMLRRWIEPEPVTVSPELQEAIGGHPLVAEILQRRGYFTTQEALAFLDPVHYQPAAAEELPGVPRAVERIEQAIQLGEKICVWGDFDVDGQTSTTLLVSALRELGGDVVFHIPVRAQESHGVNVFHLQPVLESGIRLLITCDTGISSHEAIQLARRMGVDVIVTDHHELPDQLPETHATVSPRLLPPEHPLAGLPGVGVAYKLVEALYAAFDRSAETEAFLDLVALGIVADLAHQTGDTRYLLQRGLPVLRSTRRVGLQVMMEMAGLQPSWLTEEHIGFVLGPRLNALGRLADANPVVEFLTTTEPGRARVLATHLEGLNIQRRLLTGQVLNGALAQIEKDPGLLDYAALVLSHPEWPAGVIGIVASELAERYNRPTILFSAPHGQPARGSARSIHGVNITEAIASQSKLLLSYGGHPMAAGLSLEASRISLFRRGLSKAVEQALGGEKPLPNLEIAGYVTLPELSLDLIDDLERLAPFGPGNPPLVLAIRNLSLQNATPIGREGDHIQALVADENGNTQRIVWWRGAGWPLPEGRFDLACVIRASNYRGQRDVQVEWIDARPAETDTIAFRPSSIAVLDYRSQAHPLPLLQEIARNENVIIWAEADARERLNHPVRDRSQLAPASTLVIWTTPPGREELQAALETVQPQSVILFGVDPADSSPDAFLKRLAGLVKYAIEKYGGIVSLTRLAAASGQREGTLRKALQWMEQHGLLQVTFLPENNAQISPGTGKVNPSEGETLAQLKILLAETQAYRKYFKAAEPEHLWAGIQIKT